MFTQAAVFGVAVVGGNMAVDMLEPYVVGYTG